MSLLLQIKSCVPPKTVVKIKTALYFATTNLKIVSNPKAKAKLKMCLPKTVTKNLNYNFCYCLNLKTLSTEVSFLACYSFFVALF